MLGESNRILQSRKILRLGRAAESPVRRPRSPVRFLFISQNSSRNGNFGGSVGIPRRREFRRYVFAHACVYAYAYTVTRRTYLFISLGNIISLSCAREKSAIESIARPIFCKSYMHFSENWGAFSENWGARFGKLGGIFRKTGGHGLKYRRGFFQLLFSESLTSFRIAPSIHAFGSFFVAATS